MEPLLMWGAVIVILLSLYRYFTSTFKFWEIRGVKGPKPIPVFGTFKDIILWKTYWGDYATKIYNEYENEQMVGLFSRRTPVLLLRDPDLIKDVLIKDFTAFASRGIGLQEKAEPFSAHLFRVEPERWRPLRKKLSPVFTSGKLKEMFYILQECSEQFGKYMDKVVANSPDGVVECRELTARFTMDVIGSCVFGLNMNTLSEEESEFRKRGREIFDPVPWTTFRELVKESVPDLYDFLWPIFLNRDQTKFFIHLVKGTMEFRKKNNIIRHDFIDLLSEIKDNPRELGDIEMTDTVITAQAFIFFAAGFETSSTTLSNALYELALNPSVQDKLRHEVCEEYDKNNGQLKYESIAAMKYMDLVFRETLRKYPPLPILPRESCTNYTFNGTKITIPPGVKIWIPILAMQNDPKIYPHPDLFDPHRFDDDVVKSRHQMHYLPFGDGPRNCLGARFGVYQTKIGLAKIMQNYKLETCEKTMKVYVNHPAALMLTPKEGVQLKFTKIDYD